jgi:hypothetical protein
MSQPISLPRLAVVAALSSALHSAHAHQGEKFQFVSEAHPPHPGEFTLQSQFGMFGDGPGRHLDSHVTGFFGATPWLGLLIGGQGGKEGGDGWRYESTSLGAEFLLTPHTHGSGFSAALTIEYTLLHPDEPAHDADEDDDHGEHAGHDHADDEEHDHDTHESIDPDHPEPEAPDHDDHDHSAHDHDGHASHDDHASHAHHEGFTFRLAVQQSFDSGTTVVANLNARVTDGAGGAGGYGVGVHQRFTDHWAASTEATGWFGSGESHQVVGSLLWSPCRACTIKLGGGVTLGDHTPAPVIQTGLVWRF